MVIAHIKMDFKEAKVMRYALPVDIESHKKLVKQYCLGECGEISLAIMEFLDGGRMRICYRGDCKHEAQSIKIAPDITLRKLEDKKEKSEIANG